MLGGISPMAFWRWSKSPTIRLPQPDAVIRRRKYWRRQTILDFQERMMLGPKTVEVASPPPPALRGSHQPKARRPRSAPPRKKQ
jgi:hypothetical protein